MQDRVKGMTFALFILAKYCSCWFKNWCCCPTTGLGNAASLGKESLRSYVVVVHLTNTTCVIGIVPSASEGILLNAKRSRAICSRSDCSWMISRSCIIVRGIMFVCYKRWDTSTSSESPPLPRRLLMNPQRCNLRVKLEYLTLKYEGRTSETSKFGFLTTNERPSGVHEIIFLCSPEERICINLTPHFIREEWNPPNHRKHHCHVCHPFLDLDRASRWRRYFYNVSFLWALHVKAFSLFHFSPSWNSLKEI